MLHMIICPESPSKAKESGYKRDTDNILACDGEWMQNENIDRRQDDCAMMWEKSNLPRIRV